MGSSSHESHRKNTGTHAVPHPPPPSSLLLNVHDADAPQSPPTVDADQGTSFVLPCIANGEREVEDASLVAAAAADYQDCDSEILEDLENEADLESDDEDELDRLVSEAEKAYPPDGVKAMVKELKQAGLVAFLGKHVTDTTPVLQLLVALGVLLPRSLREPTADRNVLLMLLKTSLHRLLQRREKLPQYNNLEDALSLLRDSRSTLVLSGAGISTSCGIPDFRSHDGIYARLQKAGQYDLEDPQDMFDKDVFLYRPHVFYSFAKDIYPSNFKPSPSHRFIRLLETRGQLLRNYTQNIDTLEQVAGIRRVLNCHGSFATASCVTCGFQAPGRAIKEDIFAQRVPSCPACELRRRDDKSLRKKQKRRKLTGASNKASRRSGLDSNGSDEEEDEDDDGKYRSIMKPDITFFGEKLSSTFEQYLLSDRSKASLLVIIGTSLKVAPVSSVVGHLPHNVPVILINKTPVLHVGVDIMLLGDADGIVEWLCQKLGWRLPRPLPDKDVVGEGSVAEQEAVKQEQGVSDGDGAGTGRGTEEVATWVPQRFKDTHIWLFPGAELESLDLNIEESEGDEEGDTIEEGDRDAPATESNKEGGEHGGEERQERDAQIERQAQDAQLSPLHTPREQLPKLQ